MNNKNNNTTADPNALRSSGISLTEKQLARCDAYIAEKGYKSRNQLMREIVDFYFAWQDREHIEQFITPALESVITSKIRDCESRLCNVIYKQAVQLAKLVSILADRYEIDEEEMEDHRRAAVRDVNETGGAFSIYY